MAFTLTDLRADLRADLRDAASADWSDAQLDRAIALALDELSHADPNAQQATVTVTGRTFALADTAPAGIGAADAGALLSIAAIEYPTGIYPPTYVRWSQYGGTVTVHTDAALSAEDIEVYYLRTHTLDGSGGTVADAARLPLATGASAHALRQLVAERHDAINVSGDTVAQLEREVAGRQAIWSAYLDRFRRRVRTRGLYRPDDPTSSRDIVGPIS